MMLRHCEIVGEQTGREPEAMQNFGPAARQRSEIGNQLISLPFDSIMNHLLDLVGYIPLLDFSSDLPRNSTIRRPI
jgi:hypothetical protein